MLSFHPVRFARLAAVGIAAALWVVGPAVDRASAQGTFVVDAGGGGDFADLPDAVAAAPAGALLIVLPGQYSPFTLHKALTLMGPSAGPKPFVAGLAHVVGAPRATFQHLAFRGMQATDVPGELIFDDCRFGPEGCIPPPGSSPFHPPNALSVLRCFDVEISRSYASNALSTEGTSHAALRAEKSIVRAYDSTFLGWSWSDSWSCVQQTFSAFFYEDGGHGIYAVDSQMEVSTCVIQGGEGTVACIGIGGCFYGKDGNAVRLVTSTLRLAVRESNEVDGGDAAAAVRGTLGSSAWVAGGNFAPADFLVDGLSFVQARPETAILAVVGLGGSGGVRRPRVWAPLWEPGLLVLGLGQPVALLPDWDGLLSVNPALLLATWPVVGKGLDDPVTLLLSLPADPALWGFSVRLQGFFPTLPGVIDTSVPAMTNAVRIVLDF